MAGVDPGLPVWAQNVWAPIWEQGVWFSTGGATPVITTTALPPGVENVAYSHAVVAVGGVLPYAWTIDSGSLPTGLTLHAGTGVIDGTPTVPGVYPFVIKVTDADLNTDTQPLTIIIFAAGTGQSPAATRSRYRYRVTNQIR